MKPRTTSRGGGVALFVRNHLPFIERPELNVHANINFECIFIEWSNKEFCNMVVGAVYRHPNSNYDLFMSGFKHALNKMKNTKTEYIKVGDYNIDIHMHESHEGTDKFINTVFLIHCLLL